MKSPDYSPYAGKYAQSRPGYPEELFEYLVSISDDHQVAWDCATGNGQAALSLVKYFKKVNATDISSEQIKNAVKHRQIEYRICKAEESGFDGNSVNLTTVASAVHWFNLPLFFKEVRRVSVTGAILAVWTYHVGYIEPPFDRLFLHFYKEILSSYFREGARLVDNKYSSLILPGQKINSKDFFVSVKWKLLDLFNFIDSWSGTQEYKKVNGKNPVSIIENELRDLWGDPDEIRTLRWPVFIKISRL